MTCCHSQTSHTIPSIVYMAFQCILDRSNPSCPIQRSVKIMTNLMQQLPFLQLINVTLPETNIAPENRPSQKEMSIPNSNHPFSGAMCFRDGNNVVSKPASEGFLIQNNRLLTPGQFNAGSTGGSLCHHLGSTPKLVDGTGYLNCHKIYFHTSKIV